MTEVALDTATPHAPSVIRLLLDKVGVAYREVPDHPQLAAASRVQAILLDDEIGALMVLFPQSKLLDLGRLEELTGRKLKAVPVARLKQMLDKHQLKALPAIPALTSSPCLYEGKLLEAEHLLIQSGEADLLLEIKRDDFKRMLAKASAGSFGQPVRDIRPNLDRPDDDSREITQPSRRSPRAVSRNVLKKPSRSRRWPTPRRRSSSCASTPMPPSMTSPAWSKPTRRWPPRWSAGQHRPTMPRPARFARWKTPSFACWASTW